MTLILTYRTGDKFLSVYREKKYGCGNREFSETTGSKPESGCYEGMVKKIPLYQKYWPYVS